MSFGSGHQNALIGKTADEFETSMIRKRIVCPCKEDAAIRTAHRRKRRKMDENNTAATGSMMGQAKIPDSCRHVDRNRPYLMAAENLSRTGEKLGYPSR